MKLLFLVNFYQVFNYTRAMSLAVRTIGLDARKEISDLKVKKQIQNRSGVI